MTYFYHFYCYYFFYYFLFYFHLYLEHDSSVSIVTRLKTEQLSNQVLIHGGGRVFLFAALSLELSQPPIQWVQGALNLNSKVVVV